MSRPNPLIMTRTCPYCGATYQEHAHSAAVTIEHLAEEHPAQWAALQVEAQEAFDE